MPREQNILDQKLNGVTVKVAGTILLSVLLLGWNGYALYSNLLTAIKANDEKYNAIMQEMRSMKETAQQDKNNVKEVLSRHEQQIQFLMTNQIKK